MEHKRNNILALIIQALSLKWIFFTIVAILVFILLVIAIPFASVGLLIFYLGQKLLPEKRNIKKRESSQWEDRVKNSLSFLKT